MCIFDSSSVDEALPPVRFVRQIPITIASMPHCKHLSRMTPGFGAGLVIPDLWQQEAVRALQQGKDVVVQAPTGSGKTYIFELLYPNLKTQAVFTVPTRALANDKLSEWRALGWDVGISTGDVALNLDAKVVVATLETQRGRFLRGEGPGLLVMDEFQMLGDPMRGVHYELAVALAPKATQLLFLSGSVANPHDVVAWLQRIGRDAVLIEHKTRPVPLEETDLGSHRVGPTGARPVATDPGPGSNRGEEPDETLAESCGVSSQRTQLRRARQRGGIARQSGTTQRRRRNDGTCRRNQFFHALGDRDRSTLFRRQFRAPGRSGRASPDVWSRRAPWSR